MPLSVKARIEIYLPDQPNLAYRDLLDAVVREFTLVFGGCTLVRGLDGHYLSKFGQIIPDRINIIYTDSTFSLEKNKEDLSKYAQKLRENAFIALDEEAILVAILPVYHSN